MDPATIWATIGGVVASVGAIWAVVKKILPFLRKIFHLIDDLTGEEERPGVPARLGVLGELGAVRTKLDDVTVRLGSIEHELHPNSGSSMIDKLNVRIDGLNGRLDTMSERIWKGQ